MTALEGAQPRLIAAAAATILLLTIVTICWRFARRCSRPGVLWGVGIYFMSLLAVFIYGLLSSPRFETAFGHMTMLTFPFSMATDTTAYKEGFGTLREIAHHFIRYCLIYGGMDGLILSGFLWLTVPPRLAAPRRSTR